MKRFRFSLRPVAVVRAHAELRAREALTAAVHAYVQAEATLAATRARLASLAGQLTAGRGDRFLAGDAAGLFQAYRAECQAAIEVERDVIAKRETMQQRRDGFLEARRQVKVVSRLEEKARALHGAAAARDEQKEIDEFAGTGIRRRSALS